MFGKVIFLFTLNTILLLVFHGVVKFVFKDEFHYYHYIATYLVLTISIIIAICLKNFIN
jgi:hypothetical protein